MHAERAFWPRLAAGMAIPALLAGALTAVLIGERPREVSAAHTNTPHFLSRVADVPAPTGVPALHPIVIRGGRPALGDDDAVAAGSPTRPAPPARIAVGSVGLTAPVVAVHRTASNGIGVPPPGKAGWFDGGPRPGEPGRAVLIGHVDDMAGRLAAFGRIGKVRDGAPIKLTDARGRVHEFQVVGRAQVRKNAFPASDVYGSAEHPVLVLITCGGPWLGKARGYRDNILVYARSV